MSNLIKYYNFNVTEDNKRVLENDALVAGFVPGLLTHGEVEVRDLEREEFDEEFPEELFENEQSEHGMTVEDTSSEEVLAYAHEQAGIILEEAQKEAEELVEQARVSAEFEREKIIEESKKSGYKDGLVQANDELAAQRKELEERREQLEREYQQLVDEMEPNFVRIVMGLVQKLTGVVVEDHKNVILYLMEQSMKNMGRTTQLKIRVSKEDYEKVCNAQAQLRELLREDCDMDIEMDPNMMANQCILEADNQVIDCSLDVQMRGLMEDLKLLM